MPFADLTENDNLLIYYAGYGAVDYEAEEGYWLPVDAKPDNVANWISNSTFDDALDSVMQFLLRSRSYRTE